MNLLFKALNDQTRREILEYLKEKDLTAGEIADKAGLVVSVKEGQFVYYSLNTTVMDEMLKWILQFKTEK